MTVRAEDGEGVMRPLDEEEIRRICEETLAPLSLDGRRVLVLIPDHTRHAPIALFFRLLYGILGRRVAALDYLIATGTHVPMDPMRVYRHIGITPQEHRASYPNVRVFNHEYNSPGAVVRIGEIPGEEIGRITNGLVMDPVPITVNRKVMEYDHIIIVSPVVPHETMGFAGGNKYFFPGVAGAEVVETFHWIGAVITNPVVNGIKDTPTRAIIDRAVEFIPTPRTCLACVVGDDDRLACLFGGDPRDAWSRAADVAARLHIVTLDRPVATVLALTPPIYEDLWVGGKAMYKLEPVIADGGEVIIYGPQIAAISFTHEKAIRRVGYHVIQYFLRQWDRFAGESRLIMAHASNVKGVGSFAEGVERPRIRVTLATAIPEEVCTAVNLGYMDWRTIDPAAWRERSGGDVRVVENAGQILYRLNSASTSPSFTRMQHA